ncbi:MAG TPA: hypothetical protein ENK18_06400 [Deltaproteobacteria bacterium]|nr:hypothetical protein [Deltaproteobacteria bacterium]
MTLVGILVTSIVIDKIRIESASRQAVLAQRHLVALAIEESGAIATLDKHGANGTELKAQLSMLRAAPNPIVAEMHGDAYLESLRRAEEHLPEEPGPGERAEIMQAISGIARLDQEQRVLSEALDAWAFAGRAPGCAGCLGVAHVPER